MAIEDTVSLKRWLKRADPVQMTTSELRVSPLLPERKRLGSPVNEGAVVVSHRGRKTEPKQSVCRACRIQRTAQNVAEVRRDA